NPDSVTAGESSTVWILANCPAPQGGPAHTGTATSRAFVSGVTLNPATSTASPAPTGNAAGDWVRGQAQVSGTVKRGSYTVDVKCDGTGHSGRATLRLTRPEPLPSDVPTTAPKAGGGGTYGKDVDEGSPIPLGGVGGALALALAGGAGVAVKRRRCWRWRAADAGAPRAPSRARGWSPSASACSSPRRPPPRSCQRPSTSPRSTSKRR